eukprot:TRINITY_DN11191_c0_g1_i11.p2 TRINITY_DN11191_c0_g1~~TRINITY_DN11191_c0_g1_i11.p2  ORF type:complete len:120 (-),score=10.82 TRINITY_DN11191_c0_g1_i11:192-551(-)
MLLRTIFRAALVVSVCLTLDSGWNSRYDGPNLVYISANSVVNLNKNISSVQPKIDPKKVPGATPQQLLSAWSCLGYPGPIGVLGPLTLLGPLGPFGPGSSWLSSMSSVWKGVTSNFMDS